MIIDAEQWGKAVLCVDICNNKRVTIKMLSIN